MQFYPTSPKTLKVRASVKKIPYLKLKDKLVCWYIDGNRLWEGRGKKNKDALGAGSSVSKWNIFKKEIKKRENS